MFATPLTSVVFAAALLASAAWTQTPPCDDGSDPMLERLMKYAAIEEKHRLIGLASYYSASLEGTPTASGEIFRNSRLTAAHRTLPLGTWVEVTARATGKKIRVRVNDRGPFAKKFIIDLSRSAAKAIGVDVAADRSVTIRIIGLPGEEPLPEDVLATPDEAQ